MFILLRLLLAHFIGDFVLQTNRIYAQKFKGITGVIPHSFVVAISVLVFTWPYLGLLATWIFILFVFTTHLVQDWIKANYIKIKGSFWIYILDQALHIAAMFAALFTPLKNLKPPESSNNPLVLLYNNNILMLYLIGIIIATYNGYYIISNFKKTFLSYRQEWDYSAFGKWYGIIERGGIVTLFFIGGHYVALLPLVIIARPLFYMLAKSKFDINVEFNSLLEVVLSSCVGIITGLSLSIALRYIS